MQDGAMLSGILRSKRAIRVNIEIMRALVRLRQMLASHKDLARKPEGLEKKWLPTAREGMSLSPQNS